MEIPVIRASRTYVVDFSGARPKIARYHGAGRPPSKESEREIIREAREEYNAIVNGSKTPAPVPQPAPPRVAQPSGRSRVATSATLPDVASPVANAFKDDKALLSELEFRYQMMRELIEGTTYGDTTSAIIAGGPGMGKSWTCEQVLEAAHEDPERNTRFKILQGASLTPFVFFQELHAFRHKGNVLVLDDSDTLLNDETSLMMLKAALDSKPKRRIRWGSTTPTGVEDNEFWYEGAIAFLTNQDFHAQIAKSTNGGMSKRQQHLDALRSRSNLLDLMMSDRRAQWLWTHHQITKFDVLMAHGLYKREQQDVLDWMDANKERLVECSIRSAVKLVPFVKMNRRDANQDWKRKGALIQFRSNL